MTSLRRLVRPAGLGSVCAIMLLLGACEPGEEEATETEQAPLAWDNTAYSGNGVRRIVRRECGRVCNSWDYNATPVTCRSYRSACYNEARLDYSGTKEVRLYASDADSKADPAGDNPFSAYEGNAYPDFYLGCGPQAAQNLVWFYGIKKDLIDIAYFDNFKSPGRGYVKTKRTDQLSLGFADGIATYPDELAVGVRDMLAEAGINGYIVERRSGVDVRAEAIESLNNGIPIIMMIQNGGHYVVATGYRGDEVHIIDYPGKEASTRWVKWSSLDFGVSRWATVLLHPGNWRAQTVIRLWPKRRY